MQENRSPLFTIPKWAMHFHERGKTMILKGFRGLYISLMPGLLTNLLCMSLSRNKVPVVKQSEKPTLHSVLLQRLGLPCLLFQAFNSRPGATVPTRCTSGVSTPLAGPKPYPLMVFYCHGEVFPEQGHTLLCLPCTPLLFHWTCKTGDDCLQAEKDTNMNPLKSCKRIEEPSPAGPADAEWRSHEGPAGFKVNEDHRIIES